MQIRLSTAELKHFAAEELSRRMGETVTIDDIVVNTLASDIQQTKPQVGIFDMLCMVYTFPDRCSSAKIACIKNLRESGANQGINIPLAQAKWFVESIPPLGGLTIPNNTW